VKFTEHFTSAELACRCGCGMLPDRDFMEKVEALRVKCGFAFRVTSAARCPSHNAKVSATGRSGPHTTGRAIDVGCIGKEALAVVRNALSMGFSGIGVNQKGNARFIHLDDLPEAPGQPRPWIWSY
jgi:zinc D-Ala-D-Ala carboxypeptidase